MLGGRRWKCEVSAHVTAAREAREETGGALSEELTMELLRDERTHALWLPDSSYAVFVAPICATSPACACALEKELCSLPVSEVCLITEGDGVDALQWVPWQAVRRACPRGQSRGLYKEPVPLNERELLHPFLVATVSNGLIRLPGEPL